MPTYSYRCSACASEFDQFQRFSDDPLTDCPTCGGSVKRVIQPVGVVFKGSGWYITDSRPKESDSTASGSSSSDKNKKDKSESTDSTSTAKSTDTKPEKAAASA